MLNRQLILFVLAIVIMSGCAGISGRLSPPAEPVASGEFRAGASKVDITPMPGYSMGGYAIAGQISRGVWTRLYARAVCFEDPDGRGLAMVSADLWAMPAGLADRVAELVSDEYGIRELSREQMILAVTHTHTGPANYSSSKLYNQMASLQGGFDRHLFDFFAHSMAGAIADAWQARVPARVLYKEAPLCGIARNRSIGPFLENGAEAIALIEANRDLPVRKTPFPVGCEDAYRAIDQNLRLLHVRDARGGETIAAVAFYAVHPTVMNTTTQVYNSDIFGVATYKVEATLPKANGREPVVAIFNGPEGDVAANWTRRDRFDTIELGSILSGGIMGLIESGSESETDRPAPMDVTGSIRFNFAESDLSSLAGPMSGASTLCGAEADWTFFRDAGFYEGMVQPDEEKQVPGQGVKRHPMEDDVDSKTIKDLYPWVVANVLKPPGRVPIGVYRIGPVLLATLPGEFTTMLGLRIKKGICAAASVEGPVLLVGLANEYLSYFCTCEEYDEQHYEGASMMYGPKAGMKIGEDLATLAAGLKAGEQRKEKRTYKYSVGSRGRFGVRQFDMIKHQDRLRAVHYTLAEVLADRELGMPVVDYPRFIWIDDNPEWPEDPSGRVTVMPHVAVEIRDGGVWRPLMIDGVEEDDRGVDFATVVVASLLGKTRWTTIWMPPQPIDDDPQYGSSEFRFVVKGTTGRFVSPAFTLASARKRDGLTGIARHPRAD